jgi:diguanylate cyclase (GGDEF)-like protein
MDTPLLRDRLTNFYTRDSFFSLFEDQLRKAASNKSKFSVLITDINNFKKINDKYGHVCGDAAIRFTAGTIRQVIKERGLCGRYGGDEMIVLIPGADYKRVLPTAKSIYRTLHKNKLFFSVKGKSCAVPIKLSIGIAVYPDDGSNSDALFIKADRALFISKKRGSGSITTAAKIGLARLKVTLTAAARIALVGILLILSGYFIKGRNLDRNLIAMVKAFKNPRIAEQSNDVIHLRTGSILEGRIVTETANRKIFDMKVEGGSARIYIDKSDIKRIERSSD